MIGTAAVFKERDFILASLAPGPRQKRLALAVFLVLLLTYLTIVGPLAKVQLPWVPAFFAIYGTTMMINDSITAVLLFAQFSLLRLRALLAIASGYLFTALMLLPRMLTFPDVLTPAGQLGGLQSAAWLYIISHTGFCLLVIAYALLKNGKPATRPCVGSAWAAILSSVGVTAVIVSAAAYLVTAYDRVLPALMRDPVHYAPLWPYAASIPFLATVVAGVALWARRRSVLDLWLMVVMCASAIDVALISFPVSARFSVGWYSGRVFEVLAGSIVLFVLLYEITTLYVQLLRAITALRRERTARLMTGDAVSASIAHEIRQPLAAMTTAADAGRRWLNRAVPDFAEASAAFEAISATGQRASALIESIRAMFRNDLATTTSIDVNELVSEVLEVLRDELRTHRISLRTESLARLPRIKGDRVQLRQVFVNLFTNAIDAMADIDGPRELCVRSAPHEAGGAVVSIADTGPGIAPNDVDQVFNAAFTTKAQGMGMGLSICRSIVAAHDGQLWVTSNRPRGAVFQLLLPAHTPGWEQPARAEDDRARGSDPAAA